MRVNDTKYDVCICGHERQFHKFQCGISAAVQTESKRKCKQCDCENFVLKKD